MELSERSQVSIAQIVVFVPFLAVSVFLYVRHGFGRNAGWFFLLFFSLARIVGAALQLAAIAQPANVGLLFGALTLQGVGLSDLIIVLLALVKRALEGIEKARSSSVIQPRVLFWAELFVFVGVILGAVGGSTAGSHYAQTGVYTVSSLTQAGLGLTVAGFALLVAATAVAGLNVSDAEAGERRIVLAVAVALPFLLVRVVYSAVGTFGQDPAFRAATGDVNLLLGLAVVEEIFIVFVVLAVGVTLKVLPKPEGGEAPKFPGFFGRPRLDRGQRRERRRERRTRHRGDYELHRLSPHSYPPSV
ncbi:putative transmembrane protein [Rosellinia necatrix]|uniref:Putative transmembrane protein n=1 Tax=Rosellinia necatrix TaxID=77044 RepID=A0A1W2TX58_ROSNE|nr:putative transmembrane protein [Rosellinia necatrix]